MKICTVCRSRVSEPIEAPKYIIESFNKEITLCHKTRCKTEIVRLLNKDINKRIGLLRRWYASI